MGRIGNIINKKGKQDAKRAKIFTKHARAIAVAAKEGGGNPDYNAALKTAIEKAKADNMPNDNIDRAIAKGAGAGANENYETIVYEGYGPGGVAVIVETLTDNKNRTAGNVRYYFDKNGGNLGTSGCVSFMFDNKGQILIEASDDVSEDELMEAALEAGAEDFITEEDLSLIHILYKESRTVSQISKIRNLSTSQVNDQLIKAKLEIKSMLKDKVELSKDVIDKFLVLNKNDRLKFMDSLNEERMLDFKRKLYKRIITEKNAEDLMILIWATGELKDDRFLALLHPLTSHRHSDVRRITYSALRKIESPSSREYLQRGLYDSNPQTRQYCAKALAKIGNKNSLKMLKQLRNKKNFEKEYVLRAYEEAISILEEDI